jgi:hypothetical protein
MYNHVNHTMQVTYSSSKNIQLILSNHRCTVFAEPRKCVNLAVRAYSTLVMKEYTGSVERTGWQQFTSTRLSLRSALIVANVVGVYPTRNVEGCREADITARTCWLLVRAAQRPQLV